MTRGVGGGRERRENKYLIICIEMNIGDLEDGEVRPGGVWRSRRDVRRFGLGKGNVVVCNVGEGAHSKEPSTDVLGAELGTDHEEEFVSKHLYYSFALKHT